MGQCEATHPERGPATTNRRLMQWVGTLLPARAWSANRTAIYWIDEGHPRIISHCSCADNQKNPDLTLLSGWRDINRLHYFEKLPVTTRAPGDIPL